MNHNRWTMSWNLLWHAAKLREAANSADNSLNRQYQWPLLHYTSYHLIHQITKNSDYSHFNEHFPFYQLSLTVSETTHTKWPTTNAKVSAVACHSWNNHIFLFILPIHYWYCSFIDPFIRTERCYFNCYKSQMDKSHLTIWKEN